MREIDATYALVFAGSLALALVFTRLALRIALWRGALDYPRAYERHRSPVPYLGGVAMCGAFSVAALLGAVLGQTIPAAYGELAVALGIAFGLCLMGLADDLRGLGPWIRLVVEIAAAVALYWQGVGVELSGVGPLDLALTIAWVVGITNTFNLLDNMDGLSAGVAAITAGSFFTIAATEGQEFVALLAIALVGSAIGFLHHNIHPARIYMGDAGSLFLGFMVAYLGLQLRFDAPTDVTMLVPILVLTIPILDTTLVMLCRVANGRNPLSGGSDHISHRLARLGLSVPVAVGLIYAAALVTGIAALVVSRLVVPDAWIVSGAVAVVALLAGVLLARVPVYATSESEASTPLDARNRSRAPTTETASSRSRFGRWRSRHPVHVRE